MSHESPTMRRKISLITLHRVKNYGSVLQAIASQHLLAGHDLDVELVDYWRPDLGDSISDIAEQSRWSERPLLRSAFVALRFQWARRNQQIFNRFVEQNLNLTGRTYRSEAELTEYPPHADYYAVGSDQVWNDDYNIGGSGPFFLTYAPSGAPRMAFASSLGKPAFNDVERAFVRTEVATYAAVSVRESSTVDELAQLGVRSSHVLDPTLSLSAADWEEILDLQESHGEPYILVYQLNSSDEFNQAVLEAESESGLRAKRILRKATKFKRRSVSHVVQPEVVEFVSLIRNASHVVTDSFHGLAFSLTFGVPITIVPPPKYSERLQSLLKLVGHEHRVYPGGSVSEPMDWELIEERLKNLREETGVFLEYALSECESILSGSPNDA